MYDPATEGPAEDMGTSPFDGPMQAPPSPIDNGRALLQQHGKQMAALLILGLMAFFVYDFFIGSTIKVTIEARDTEGKLVGSAHGSLFEGSAGSPFKTFNGSTTLDLRPGDYRVEWTTQGSVYQDPGTQDFTIAKEDGKEQTQKTTLEKNIPVTLSTLVFPGTLVLGQDGAQGSLTLENKSTQNQTVELAFDKDVGSAILDIQTQPGTLTIPTQGTLIVNLSISVSPTLTIKSPSKGDPKTGKIRIKGTLEGKDVAYTLYKSFDLDVNPKTPQTFTATANKLLSKTFTLRNPNSTDSGETIQASVSIKSTQNNDASAMETWFKWSPTLPFASLKKSESVPVQLQILAPPSASTDTITGEIKFYTGTWSQVIPFTLNLTEAKVQLKTTLDGSDTFKKYSLSQDASGVYESKNALLKLENLGALAIENILMQTEGCESYIQQVDPNFFLSLKLAEQGKSGSSKTTTLHITAPASALPNDSKTCLLQISYLDPKTGDVSQNDPINVEIDT